ncbi:MAG TPA: PhzF family phenazine biosynthesis protein [Longimicrobium sp.]|jgi:PhzF family phenazine biosynthesis protein|uniref:PhzF family phenazine biosynthesis protein n=1 Tax=Longimicrobium sp. TaxID=2029185 RepID=UPI002ED784B3
MRRRFQQVDVFSPTAYLGNPLAVVLDGDGLSMEEMQRISSWTNLSETTFLLPPTSPEADYRVRIFSLARELPFAGHPTLGSCHAWLTAGGAPHNPDVIIQECGAGLVPIRRGEHGLAFAAPPLIRSGPVDEPFLARVAGVLGIARTEIVDAEWVANGPGWVGVLLKDADAVLALEPDAAGHTGEDSLDIGIVGLYPPGSECAYEVRAVFSDDQGTLREDPVTGSLNASVAQWLVRTGRAVPPYVASQGTRLGRTGRPRIEQDASGTLWVGGPTITCIHGHLDA